MKQNPSQSPAHDPLSGPSQFQVRAVGLVKCCSCNYVAAASEYRPREPPALVDGPSGKPDDFLALIPLRCPICGTDGWLDVRYGNETSPEEAEVLRHLYRRRPLAA